MARNRGGSQVLEGTRFFSLLLQVKGDLQSIARTIAAAGCLPLLVRIIGSDSSTGDARNQVCAADSCLERTNHQRCSFAQAVLCLHTIVKKGCCVLTPEIIDIDMISVLQRVGTLEFVLSGASATANLAETALRTLGYIARAGPQLRDAVVAAGAAESVTALLLQADEVSEHPHGGVPSAVLFTALHAAKKMIGVKPTPPIAGVYEQLVRAAARHLELCNATVSLVANQYDARSPRRDAAFVSLSMRCSPRIHPQRLTRDIRGPSPMFSGLCTTRAWMTEVWTFLSTALTFAP